MTTPLVRTGPPAISRGNNSATSTSSESSIVMEQGKTYPENAEERLEGQKESVECRNQTLYERLLSWWDPWRVRDGRYDRFKSFDCRLIRIYGFRTLKLLDTVESFPDGYPRLTAVMDSDSNTRVYRRFGLIRNRLLLHKQDQIFELSERLNDLDKVDETLYPDRLFCRRYDEELGDRSQRPQILQSLEQSLKEYDGLLLREHSISSIPRPSRKNHRAIFDWVYNNKPVVREEYQYLYDERDFVLLGHQQDQWFRSCQEKIWNLSHNRLFKVSACIPTSSNSKHILKKFQKLLSSDLHTSDSHSTYLSNKKAILIVQLFLAFTMTTLLMLPVVLLYVLDSSTGIKIAVTVIFVLMFSTLLLTMGNAKRHEAFAATAAYAAVLVVFLANLPTGSVR